MSLLNIYHKWRVIVVSLYEAIYARKSVRRYNIKPIDQEQLDLLLRFAKSLPMLFPDIEVEFKILDCTDEKQYKQYFSGIELFRAPYYLTISSTKNNGYYINAGYIMQQISLYLTSKKIGSCFLGLVKLASDLVEDPLKEHIITLAFGQAKSEINRVSGKLRRLPEEDIVTYKEDVNESLITILKAGRLAPSSMNNQPWRFVAYKNRVHVFCKKNIIKSELVSRMKLIDIGVAIGNMLVVTDEMWIKVDTFHSPSISNHHFKHNDYVVTLSLSSAF